MGLVVGDRQPHRTQRLRHRISESVGGAMDSESGRSAVDRGGYAREQQPVVRGLAAEGQACGGVLLAVLAGAPEPGPSEGQTNEDSPTFQSTLDVHGTRRQRHCALPPQGDCCSK